MFQQNFTYKNYIIYVHKNGKNIVTCTYALIVRSFVRAMNTNRTSPNMCYRGRS